MKNNIWGLIFVCVGCAAIGAELGWKIGVGIGGILAGYGPLLKELFKDES